MNNFFDEVFVVLVIYQIKIADSPAYRSLSSALNKSSQSVSLYIYDNSPFAQETPIDTQWTIQYVHDPSNPGVSKAYNKGFELAKTAKKKWLLLADQDTVFPLVIFEKYIQAIASSSSELISALASFQNTIISPFRFEVGRGRSLSNAKPGRYSLHSYNFINSGTLVSIRLFEKSGGYDERFPLDFSDLAFAKRVGTLINEFTVVDALCMQPLSAGEDSPEVALNRFMTFVRASRQYGKVYGSPLFLLMNRFLRAIKLGLQFSSLRFLKLLVKD